MGVDMNLESGIRIHHVCHPVQFFLGIGTEVGLPGFELQLVKNDGGRSALQLNVELKSFAFGEACS